MKKNFLNKLLVFLVLYLIFSYAVSFFVDPSQSDQPQNDIEITVDKEIGKGTLVTAEITNNTDKTVTIPNNCPSQPLAVLTYTQGEWQSKSTTPDIDCNSDSLFKGEKFTIEPNSSLSIPYTYWSNSLFDTQNQRYKLSAEITDSDGQSKTYESNEFEVTRPSIFRLLWITVLYQPIFNALIWLITVMPGYSLGLAIILLTIIIRSILLAPSQKAMRAQKRMQEIQPKLQAIRKKYKGNQEKIAQETMKIWKNQKVNPFGSCLPLLIQFPILIALFYVVQSGLNPDQSTLLYSGLKDFTFTDIQTNFLNILELTEINSFWLPLVIGLLQFAQMKLGLMRQEKKKKTKETKNDKKEKSEMEIANSMMIYFLPVMIAMFTASLPAGVGLYWGVSTSFGIVQQIIINREKPSEPKVKVIDNN